MTLVIGWTVPELLKEQNAFIFKGWRGQEECLFLNITALKSFWTLGTTWPVTCLIPDDMSCWKQCLCFSHILWVLNFLKGLNKHQYIQFSSQLYKIWSDMCYNYSLLGCDTIQSRAQYTVSWHQHEDQVVFSLQAYFCFNISYRNTW
jgi:hypothetical protein